MSAVGQPGLALWGVLVLAACSTTPRAHVTTEPPASEPATATPTEPRVPTPPAWLAHFTLTPDVATAVHGALASQEAMTGREAVEWITRVAAALAQVPPEAHDEAEAQAWALAGLLIEEMASTARDCQVQRRPAMSDIASMAQRLGEQRCPDFTEIVSELYRSCSAPSFPDIAQFCEERLQRWERAVGPACAPYAARETAGSADSSVKTDVLRFTVVDTLLHADEVDAVGEALARTLSERTGGAVRYESDSGFEYASQCSAAYTPMPHGGDWNAILQYDGESAGTIDVAGLRHTDAWMADVAAPHHPSSWLRAASALVQAAGPLHDLASLLLSSGHAPPRIEVLKSHHLPRSVDRTWDAITAALEHCNPWGTLQWVVSISASGQLVRATPRIPWGTPFDVPGVRCLTRELDALSRPGRAVARAVIELSPGPASLSSDAFPLNNSPRVDACVGDTPVDLCLDVAPDGGVTHWNAARAWEGFPRALADVPATPVTPAIAQCFASVFERGVACTPRGDQLVLDLPSRP